MVPVLSFHAWKGEGHQGRLATPKEIEERKQNRAAEAAVVEPYQSQSGSETSAYALSDLGMRPQKSKEDQPRRTNPEGPTQRLGVLAELWWDRTRPQRRP